MTQEEILEKVHYFARLRGISPCTEEDYTLKINSFQKHYGKPATELGLAEVQDYLYYLLTERKISSTSINVYNSAIRFLYLNVLDTPLELSKIPRHKNHRKFPNILTKDEVATLLASASNLRDKALLATMYGAGLRISEAVSLKVKDIDSANMQIFINSGKGSKDRFAILSQTSLNILREYWMEYHPKEWLFESISNNKTKSHLSVRGAQNVFRKTVLKAGIEKPVTTHTLRHSFATHLLEDGVDIFHIKQLLGHVDIRTSCIYLHMISISDMNVSSPLDTLSLVNRDA